MAETAPASRRNTLQTASTDASSSSRIRFPSEQPDLAQAGPSSGEGSFRPSSPHVKSVSTRQSPTPYRQSALDAPGTNKRRVRGHPSTKMRKGERAVSPASMDLGLGALSEEYDLSHEDPRILQDVQRAVKLKARREARLKAAQTSPPRKSIPHQASVPAGPTYVENFPAMPTVATTSSPLGHGNLGSSDLDFGPSTGATILPTVLHPVPSSSDDGLTLDWTGPTSDDEKSDRRWTLSISKRKGKDKELSVSNFPIDQQEALYGDKIRRIKVSTSSQTQYKAAITADQLQRRYNLIGRTYGNQLYNLANVARWYARQELIVRSTLEKAEPFTWLKHLDKRRGTTLPRSPWHLSALTMEEFLQAGGHQDTMTPIPEEHMPLPSPNSPLSPQMSPVPSIIMQSRASSRHNLGPSLSRRRSVDGRVSFEPIRETVRGSIDTDSRQSGEGSIYSSIFSASSAHRHKGGAPSPDSTRLDIRDLKPLRRRQAADSDGASSSAHNSVSEWSDDGKRVPKVFAGVSSKSESPPEPDLNIKIVVSGDPYEPGAPSTGYTDGRDDSDIHRPSSVTEVLPPEPLTATPRNLGQNRLRVRISLPSSQWRVYEEERAQEDEEELRREYEFKSRLLQETTSQNYRTRQLLNRVAAAVREYETIQSSLMRSLGVPYRSLPNELLEAFGHDPAAVTGGTRRYQGWRAVDDIHRRIIRQREAFQTFLAQAADNSALTVPGSVLDDPISSLLRSLEALESHKQEILVKAAEVADKLKAVKSIHASVKKEYYDTVSHTAIMYPELSHIVALEESYKDQYQQFWEIGMDALTFLLDTVAPFWRTYGKTIGEDVQDFLIIPLYRNEFTGEAKRYPIVRLPKRSFRHWMSLLLFFFTAIAVNLLQARAAIFSSINYRLSWITQSGIRWMIVPFFWIAIPIQWCAVIIEFFIVVTQIGVVTWWFGWIVRLWT